MYLVEVNGTAMEFFQSYLNNYLIYCFPFQFTVVKGPGELKFFNCLSIIAVNVSNHTL